MGPQVSDTASCPGNYPVLLAAELLPERVLPLSPLTLRKVIRLGHLPDLDLRVVDRAALHPLDRLIERLHLQNPEAGDELLRLGEWPVHDGLLSAREPDAHPLGARVKPLAREHHAGAYQLLVVLGHLVELFDAGN